MNFTIGRCATKMTIEANDTNPKECNGIQRTEYSRFALQEMWEKKTFLC